MVGPLQLGRGLMVKIQTHPVFREIQYLSIFFVGKDPGTTQRGDLMETVEGNQSNSPSFQFQ